MTKAFKMQVANWQFEKLIQILTLNFKTKSNKCYFSLFFFSFPLICFSLTQIASSYNHKPKYL